MPCYTVGMKKQTLNKALSITFGVALLFFMLTVSIALPIYSRWFYYLHVDALNLSSLGWTRAEIIGAFREVMNYLTMPGFEFGTGVLAHSADGAAHFADVKGLFNLNIIVLIISGAILLTLLILKKKKIWQFCYIKGFSPAFFSAIGALILPLVLGGMVAADPDGAFVVFHHIFFPGKTNWVFNPADDQIIQILPQEYFINCAAFIAVGLIVFTLTIIIVEIVSRKKRLSKILLVRSSRQGVNYG